MLKKFRKMLDSLLKRPKQKEQETQRNTGTKLGRMVYTSKSQKEAEADTGEKLHKMANRVYVDQATYDFIQSEEIPVIEDEVLDAFTKIEIEETETIAAVWDETDTRLFILTETNSPKEFTYSIFKFSGESYTRIKHRRIFFDEYLRHFRSLAVDTSQNYLLLTFKNHLVIWDFATDTPVISLRVEGNGLIRSGFYPDDFQAWALVLNEEQTGCEWLRWEYFSDFYDIYELEDKDHYGRGASLHPSGLLIGALWNAYECGYYVHTFVSDNSEIRYYSKPTARRGEYENHSPCFSPDGKTFAFIANPYLAMHHNYTRICIYNLETAELIKEFYSGLSHVRESQLQFVHGGKRIAFFAWDSNNAYVFNPENGKRLAVLEAAATIRYFSGHRLAGYYALAHAKGVTIYYSNTLGEGNAEEFQAVAEAVAKKFIESNEVYLAKPNDWGNQPKLTGTLNFDIEE